MVLLVICSYQLHLVPRAPRGIVDTACSAFANSHELFIPRREAIRSVISLLTHADPLVRCLTHMHSVLMCRSTRRILTLPTSQDGRISERRMSVRDRCMPCYDRDR